MSDDAPEAAVEEGLPAWVMTFADLMSLLMCFFVLLLSFSEMDVQKFKEMAGSMQNAFGVQRDIKVKESPKGISVIAREFSPGRPDPTIMNVIRQMTTNDLRVNLDLGKQRRRPVPTPKSEQVPDKDKTVKPQESAKNKAQQQDGQKAGNKADVKEGSESGKMAQLMAGRTRGQADGLTKEQQKELRQAKRLAVVRLREKLKAQQQLARMQAKFGVAKDLSKVSEEMKAKLAAERRKKLESRAKLISNALGKEIKAGSVEVETEGKKIIIRIQEKASFTSGMDELKLAFLPLLDKVTKILKSSEGQIVVAGHTDNIPIFTERFRSNWELSSARAVSVAHEMMRATKIPSSRFLVQGFADTKPIVPNNSIANRAKNRRVEIILLQGKDKESNKILSGIKKAKSGEKIVPLSAKLKSENSAKVDSKANIPGKLGLVKKAVPGIRIGGADSTKRSAKTKQMRKPNQKSVSGIRIGGSKSSIAKAKPVAGIKIGGAGSSGRKQKDVAGIKIGGAKPKAAIQKSTVGIKIGGASASSKKKSATPGIRIGGAKSATPVIKRVSENESSSTPGIKIGGN